MRPRTSDYSLVEWLIVLMVMLVSAAWGAWLVYELFASALRWTAP